MRLRVELGGVTVFAFELPMQITPVDEMFRFVSLRGAYDDEIYDFSSYGPTPSAGTDEELWNKDVFFVHGFNVSENGAREWNREIFKRLWVSGSKARYWGVTWSGDCHIASEAFNGLHYHRDVRQALLTAPSFARLVNSRGHDVVVIGHSLGNMVVSESLLKGCNAAKYFMLDAAVASVFEIHNSGQTSIMNFAQPCTLRSAPVRYGEVHPCTVEMCIRALWHMHGCATSPKRGIMCGVKVCYNMRR